MMQDLRNEAIAAHKKENFPRAVELYRQYLEGWPDDAGMWSNLGALFRKHHKFDLAIAAHRRAQEIAPESPDYNHNYANALYDGGFKEDAKKIRQNLLLQLPENRENIAMLAKCLRGLGRYNQAERFLKKHIKLAPDEVEFHIQLSMAQLALGNYQGGFASFNYRWKGDELTLPELDIAKWTGQDLTGKTILIYPEQGHGDTILMARFINQLKALGCVIKVNSKPALGRCFAGLDGMDELVTLKSELTDVDYWVPIMDLPLYLGTTPDTIPPPANLAVPQSSVARAKSITAPYKNRFKLGVMWSGSTTYRGNQNRSFTHQEFLRFADIPGLQLFSLYKGPLLKEYLEDGTACIITNASGNDQDFADSAALIKELDLVITMDSAIAHLAGSLGAPVWNLLHSEAYWLYELFKTHTPWYPSMRLIRQKTPRDWDHVFQIAHKDLAVLVSEWKVKNG